MATATKTSVKRTINRVRGAVSEMNYAQRRLFEISTGVPVDGPHEPQSDATSVEELESLYELEQDGKLAA